LNGSDPSMIVVSAVACLSFKAHRHAALSLDNNRNINLDEDALARRDVKPRCPLPPARQGGNRYITRVMGLRRG
jgi:hypothetical protein